MKLNIIKNNFIFFLLEFFFLLGMWMSKTVWPLWVSEGGNIKFYGISYCVMAITGAFSINIGQKMSQYSSRTSLIFGLILYAFGISLRWFHHSLIAYIFSGLLGGIGASICILTFRVLARAIQGENGNPAFISARKIMSTTGSALAALIVSQILLFFNSNILSYQISVLGACIPVGISILLLFYSQKYLFLNHRTNTNVKIKLFSFSGLISDLKILPKELQNLILLNGFSGFCFSLILPYLPIYYKNLGFSSSNIAKLTTLITILNVIVQPFSSTLLQKYNKSTIYIIGESIHWGSILFLTLINQSIFIVPISIIRVLSRNISALAEEIIEVERIPENKSSISYGAIQSLFLMGDSLGGLVGGTLSSSVSIQFTLIFATILSLLHSILFYKLSQKKV